MEELRERVAVVTGAASGIGEALARALANEGVRLVLADVDRASMEKVSEELRSLGTEVLAVPTDVRRLEDVRNLADRAFGHFGEVHIVCNNAGVAVYGGLEKASHADWEWVLGVNLWGVIHGVEVFVPRLVAQGKGGHIVNTASMAGLVPMQGMGVYVTSKYAVVGLSETLYRDLSAYGIGVTVLCPMLVATRIGQSERNRPPELGGRPGTAPEPVSFVGRVLPPELVARRTLEAIRGGELYVFTHPESKEILRRRFARLDRAAQKAAED